ncbi:hypothetical protein VUR80DRAFT_6807 [Thermomyces stellatus]
MTLPIAAHRSITPEQIPRRITDRATILNRRRRPSFVSNPTGPSHSAQVKVLFKLRAHPSSWAFGSRHHVVTYTFTYPPPGPPTKPRWSAADELSGILPR